MGVEPAPGTGASDAADPHAHDRVCSCHRACQGADCQLACSRVWLLPTRHRHFLESWPLLWKALCPPARRDTVLSSRQDAAPDRAAHRARWLSAGALRRQDWRLSCLSLARAVSVARLSDDKAASGQSAAASARGGICASALAGLEPQGAEARLYAPAAPPTGGHNAGAGPAASRTIVAYLLSCAAGTLPSLFCRAVGAQCPRPHCWPDHDPALRRAWCFLQLPRPAHPSVASSRFDEGRFSSERRASPSGCACLLGLGCSNLLLVLLPIPLSLSTFLSATFASGRRSSTYSEINSSIPSLRNSWAMQALSIHRLVQAVLRDAMGEEQARQWAEHSVKILS